MLLLFLQSFVPDPHRDCPIDAISIGGSPIRRWTSASFSRTASKHPTTAKIPDPSAKHVVRADELHGSFGQAGTLELLLGLTLINNMRPCHKPFEPLGCIRRSALSKDEIDVYEIIG